MVGLGNLPDLDFESVALGVSVEASVVLGGGVTALGITAFLWDDAKGMRSLQDTLSLDLGLDLTGWTLNDANGIEVETDIDV